MYSQSTSHRGADSSTVLQVLALPQSKRMKFLCRKGPTWHSRMWPCLPSPLTENHNFLQGRSSLLRTECRVGEQRGDGPTWRLFLWPCLLSPPTENQTVSHTRLQFVTMSRSTLGELEVLP